MKFRVERDPLADAVAWTARSLPARPAVPVLGGVLLEVADGTLTVSGFDYEVSTQVEVDVHASTAGRSLVSGRLLAEISRALPPHPVDVAVDGPRVTITCGNARFTLPVMPVEDYPTLPSMPTTAGVVDSVDLRHGGVPGRGGRGPGRHAADADRRPAGDRGRAAAARRHRPLPAGRPGAAVEAGAERPRRPGAHPGPDAGRVGQDAHHRLRDHPRAVRRRRRRGHDRLRRPGPAQHHPAARRRVPEVPLALPVGVVGDRGHPGAGAAGGGQAGRPGRRSRHPGAARLRRGRRSA